MSQAKIRLRKHLPGVTDASGGTLHSQGFPDITPENRAKGIRLTFF
jgi:hypothetical protein